MYRFANSNLFMIFGVAVMVCSICAAADNNQREPVSISEPDTTEIQAKLTLEQCIEIALHNNPAVAQKQWEAETAQAEKDIAVGRLWPEISANGGYNHYRDYRLIQPRRPGTSESLQFTDELISGDIVLTMPLYMGGRLVNQVKAADFITQSAQQQLLFSQAELVFNVSSVFYSILGQREVIASLIFSQKALQEHHKKTMELLNAKKAARVDLLRTEVRLADIEQRIMYERNVLNIKHSLMISLLGLNIKNKTPDIEGELIMIDVPAGLGRGLETALENRQDCKSLKSKLEAQQEILNIAKAGRLPEVSLRASYGNRWDADSSEDNLVGDIGIFVAIPIFEGGRIDAGIRREHSRLRAQKEALRKLELQIRLQVESAVSNIESVRARVGVMQKAVEQARESLRIEREKYDQGKGAIVDVLDAQSAMLESQTNYYRSLSDYNTAVAQFRMAVGE